MTAVPDKNTFASMYAGQGPPVSGKPQKAFFDVADRGIKGRGQDRPVSLGLLTDGSWAGIEGQQNTFLPYPK